MKLLCLFQYGFMTSNLSSPTAVCTRYYLNVVPNVVTSHLPHTLIFETGLVCNTAEQIESASQLKRHTYLIRPVIQGHALLLLHNTLSMFVTPAPKVALKYCHFPYCKPRPAPPLATSFCSPLLSVFVGSSLWGASTKVHITHIITNAYYVNAHIADQSERGGKDT